MRGSERCVGQRVLLGVEGSVLAMVVRQYNNYLSGRGEGATLDPLHERIGSHSTSKMNIYLAVVTLDPLHGGHECSDEVGTTYKVSRTFPRIRPGLSYMCRIRSRAVGGFALHAPIQWAI